MSRKILIPFDYSDESRNSLEYGVEFSKEYGFEIILFHSYEIPIYSAESAFINYPIEVLINENKSALEKEAEKINKQKAKNILVQCEVSIGSTVENILRKSVELKADLILMSVTHRGRISEVIIGSNAVFVARKSLVPTFIIPANLVFKKIKKIACAIDTLKYLNEKFITQLKYFQELFNSNLDIINFSNEEEETVMLERTIGELRTENMFSHVAHKTFYLNQKPEDGIDKILENSKYDLIAIAPAEHGYLSDIFNEGITKHLAYHTEIPLMCLNLNAI